MIGLILNVIAIAGLAILGFGIFLAIQSVQRNQTVRSGVMLAAVGLVIAVLFFVMNAGLVEVKANEVAVVFNTFNGNLAKKPLGPGMHIIIPGVQEATIYSTAQQEYTMSGQSSEGAVKGDDAVTALTSDGQQVKLDVTIFYRVNAAMANTLHLTWQSRYQDALIRPVVRNQTRAALTRFTVEQVYGAEHDQLQQAIEDAVRKEVADDGIEVTDVLIRNITFSQDYVNAIDQKQIAQQQSEEARFRVQQKEQEADQARAVAQGEADSARIRAEGEAAALQLINEQLSQNPLLLQWRYIETLGDNVRIVVIPSNSPFLFDMNQLMTSAGADLTAPATTPSQNNTGSSTNQ